MKPRPTGRSTGRLRPAACAALAAGALVLSPAATAAQAGPCPTGRVPVEGRVLDLLTLTPLPGATVSGFTVEGGLAGSVTADEEGGYRLCAVSGTEGLVLRAFLDEASGPEAEARPGQEGARRDVYLRATEPGSVRGTVTDRTDGAPVEGVFIVMPGARRTAVTGPEGRFEIPNVPAGHHPVTLRHVAYGERADSVEVASGEEVEVRVEVAPRAVELDPLVVVTRRVPSDAERVGIRYDGLGRDEIDRLLAATRSFPALLQNAHVPGLTVRETTFSGPGGTPALCLESGRRRGRARPGDIGCYMMEVYLDGVRMPSPEMSLPGLDPNVVDSLQVVPPVWAIGRFGGPRVHNGVLLIYTRRR